MEREYPLKLSIIVPVYNVEQYLERCVASLLDQDIDKSEYEIILINDGSTDNSYEIAQQLAKINQNITLYCQENKGQGAARNFGIERASGHYLLFVDSDDYLLPNVLKKILEIADSSNPEIVIMRTKSMKEDGSFYQYKPPFDTGIIYTGEQILIDGYRPASVWGKLYHRDLLVRNSIKFIEGIIHEDVDFNLKLFSYAKRICFTDLCVYVYYWNDLSTDKFMNHDKIRKSIISDILIAKDLKLFSKRQHLSLSLRQFYQRHANSMTVSVYYSFFTKYRALPFSDKKEHFKKMEREKIIPIKGKTNSYKSNLIAVVLSNTKLAFLILCFFSFWLKLMQ